MTFDDGILTIYNMANLAQSGNKPQWALVNPTPFYFAFETIGVNRYYVALQANQQINEVVSIPDWNKIEPTDICVLDGEQYRINLVQKTRDDNNLKITKLSLERINQNYAIEVN